MGKLSLTEPLTPWTRSWLERQQNCPICRTSVFGTASQQATAAAAAAAAARLPGHAPAPREVAPIAGAAAGQAGEAQGAAQQAAEEPPDLSLGQQQPVGCVRLRSSCLFASLLLEFCGLLVEMDKS